MTCRGDLLEILTLDVRMLTALAFLPDEHIYDTFGDVRKIVTFSL